MSKGDDIDEIIAGGGIVFRNTPKESDDKKKVKTKAKKKGYITGAHGSGSAKKRNTEINGPTDINKLNPANFQ